jgi:Zn-dependent protease/CBS domain-containing protein
MDASIRLGSIRGIPVGIHYSWFVVFFALSGILALGQYPTNYPEWSDAGYWVVAVASVLLLFFSVLLHEFGHAVTAQKLGIPVISITLFIFGGVAAISQDAESPGDEFKIAIAGPIVSVLTGLTFAAIFIALGEINEQASALVGYLALINIVLAVFNMLPGFPLDGGRVLRSIIWKVTGSVRRSTRIVATIGSLLGSLLFVLGIFAIFQGNLINGVYSVAIGWFLQNAASQGRQQVEQEVALRDVYVHDLMQHDPVTVDPGLDIQTLVDDYVLGQNVRGMPVCDDGRLVGIITVNDIKEISRDEWPRRQVSELMTGLAELQTVAELTPVNEVLRMMAEHDFHQIPVLRDGNLVGLITRSGLVRYLQYRQELGVDA